MLLLAVLIVLSIIKQFFKLVILLILLAVLYAGYLYLTGQKIPVNSNQFLQQGNRQIEMLKKGSGKLVDGVRPLK